MVEMRIDSVICSMMSHVLIVVIHKRLWLEWKEYLS